MSPPVSTSRLPVTFLFAGQGSQYFQMGRQLYLEHPVFREWMEIGDQILQDHCGIALLEQLYGAERSVGAAFDDLELSHPAIFLVEYALAKVMEHHHFWPDRLLGVSLGEFTAMTFAGRLPFERTLRAVAAQPALFRRHCEGGRMLAVLASPALHADNPVLAACSELAGSNNDKHFVLAAPDAALPAIRAELQRLDIVHQDLQVPFAFHTRWIDAAADACRAAMADTRLRPPRWPCFSTSLQRFTEPDEPDLFWQIVRAPMDFRGAVRRLEALGGALYVDLSPSGTLAGLVKQILPPGSRSRVQAIMSPFGNELKRLDSLLSEATEASDAGRAVAGLYAS